MGVALHPAERQNHPPHSSPGGRGAASRPRTLVRRPPPRPQTRWPGSARGGRARTPGDGWIGMGYVFERVRGGFLCFLRGAGTPVTATVALASSFFSRRKTARYSLLPLSHPLARPAAKPGGPAARTAQQAGRLAAVVCVYVSECVHVREGRRGAHPRCSAATHPLPQKNARHSRRPGSASSRLGAGADVEARPVMACVCFGCDVFRRAEKKKGV
jgi:hypothetical protein